MNETNLTCCCCGTELTPENSYQFDNNIYCANCFHDLTVECEDCGRRIYRDDAITTTSSYVICQHCYDRNYLTCERCGNAVYIDDAYYMDDDEDDEYPYCPSCYSHEHNHRIIHDYGYKPDPVFYGQDKRYFGVELEVDRGGYDECNANEILGIANTGGKKRIYIKHDGSIDDGFEIVTHPMSLDYHKNEMPWQNMMLELVDMGYRSHKTSTCGLHCHVNRTAFGESYDEQEEVIARILYFVEHHWDEMLKFSRRTEGQMARWAARYGMKNKPKELMDDAKKNNYNRYKCVNIQNFSTIEFRLFRGTLKYNTFIATLQLINEICDVAVSLSDEEMTQLSWTDFLNRINKDSNKELFTYLEERNLLTEVKEGIA